MISLLRALLLLSCLFLISLISCNKKSELVYISYERPDNLIPNLNMNEEGKYISELIFDGLVNKTTVSAEGREQYQWTLVSEGGYVEESPDNRFLISIYLKKGINWHNGTELTTKDVLYTWKSIQQSNSPLKGWLSSFVDDISLIENDNYKFKIQLKVERSKEAFMELFAPVKILPHEFLDNGTFVELPYNLSENSKYVNAFKWKPVGTGPYSIEERESEFIILNANAGYLSPSAPQIPVLRYVIEKDRNMAIKTLNNTETGILFNVNPESFEALGQDKFEYATYVPYSFYVIAYNTLNPPFNNIDFRKAINSLTDKEGLTQAFLGDVTLETKKFINHSIFPSNSRYVINSPQSYPEQAPFNTPNAKTFLGKAGSVKRSFNLLVSSAIDGENRIRAFTDLYSRQMQSEGVKVGINDVTSPVYYQKIRDRAYDAVLIQLTGFDHFFDIRGLFKEGGDRNFWGINDTKLNMLLEKFGTTIAWDKLLKTSVDIHSRIEELSPGCFVFTVPRKAYFSKDIEGVYVHPEVGFSNVESWTYKSK